MSKSEVFNEDCMVSMRRYPDKYFGHLTNRVDLIDLPNCKQKFTNVEGVIG